ncbi:MAG: hypothetical protein DMF69_20590 [Acidobacteria bacterium]|nr:MAG: hypothetical protein DMF69_20590 [Acidobacteriota bacterium]
MNPTRRSFLRTVSGAALVAAVPTSVPKRLSFGSLHFHRSTD